MRGNSLKAALCVAAAVLSLALGGAARADVLTLGIGAHVESVYDPDNVLGGQVTVGQTISGRVSYETGVPDQNPDDPTVGSYPQTPQQGRMSFTVGGLTFESDGASPGWSFSMGVLIPPPPPYTAIWYSYFVGSSMGNKPLPNGASVTWMYFNFHADWQVLWTDAMLTTAPDLNAFTDRTGQLGGQSQTGGYYYVQFRIDSAEVLPTLLVSPSDGRFFRTQQVGAAAIGLNSPFVALRGSVNGTPLPADYIQQCRAAPANSQSRPGMVCPDIVPFLLGGHNRVEWSADFGDGTTATRAVDWEVIE